MSKINLAIFLLILICFSGCTSQQEVLQQNKAELSRDGDDIGVLPDGRKLRRYCIWRYVGDNGYQEDYVYVVDGSVSVNRTIRKGKTSKHQTTVFIDGIEYKPVDEPVAEINGL